MYFDDFNSDSTIPFGKYRGVSITDLAQEDPGYLNWILSLGEGDTGFAAWGTTHRGDILEALSDGRLSKLHANFPEFTLSTSQEEAVQKINTQLLADPECHMFRLQGAAGYGKSFSTMEIVRQAMEMGFSVNACAISYVATQNLRKDLEPLGVTCKTVASMFRQERVFVDRGEQYNLTEESYAAMADLLREDCMIIVDEYSMVSDDVGQALIDHANHCGGKLLVVGDIGQLPSPSQDTDSILNQVQPSTSLTEPMRYKAGSDLHRVETTVRDNPYTLDLSEFEGSSSVITHTGREAFIQAYVERYRSADPETAVKMLWYRRKDVIQSNREIRTALFGEDAGIIEEDEQLMVMRTTDVPLYYTGTRNPIIDEFGHNATLRMYSGQNYRVSELAEDEVTFTVTPSAIDPITKLPLDSPPAPVTFVIPTYRAILDNGLQADLIFAISETQAQADTRGGKEYNEALQEIAAMCSNGVLSGWRTYHDFRTKFLSVAHSYASTVHRSQGASLEVIFTNLPSLLAANRFTATKLAYVGMTRAKQELHLLT